MDKEQKLLNTSATAKAFEDHKYALYKDAKKEWEAAKQGSMDADVALVEFYRQKEGLG